MPIPIVVQVNKQDVKGALDPERMRRRLKLDAAVPTLPASASLNQGVKETLATATRLRAPRARLTRCSSRSSPSSRTPTRSSTTCLRFEDKPHEGPVDAEELYVAAEDVDTEGEAAAAHLVASTLDDLEARARRAARGPKRERGAT